MLSLGHLPSSVELKGNVQLGADHHDLHAKNKVLKSYKLCLLTYLLSYFTNYGLKFNFGQTTPKCS